MSETVLKLTERVPERVLRSVVDQIVAKFQPERIILFGSHAYGTPSPESDVDLLVVMDSPRRNVEQALVIARELDCHFALDLMVRRPQQLAERIAMGDFFLRDIAEKGKVLYERVDARVD